MFPEFSIIILIVIMILYATEAIPLAATALASCAALAVFGLAPGTVVWSGLAADTTLVVGGMIVVGITLLENGVAERLGNWILHRTGNKPEFSCLCVVVVAIVLSGFMNNAASVATMMPVILGVVVASGGKLHEKRWLLPMAAATNAGGMLTLIGTTSQMIVQTALESHGYPLFHFFDFAWIVVPLCVLFLVYIATVGKWLGKRIWPEGSPHSETVTVLQEKGPEHKGTSAPVSPRKQVMSVLIMLISITLMVLNVGIPNGTIAMAAAILCVVTRCISIKRLYMKFDWTTVFVLAGGIGFANGLDYCGGGRMIADWLMGLFRDALTPQTVFIMFVVIATLLTQFMSNTAVAAMLTPIALPFVDLIGINPLALLMGICAATNLSFSTPIATPSMTLVLGPGDYKFIDYAKWCGVFNIMCILCVLYIIPQVWPLG